MPADISLAVDIDGFNESTKTRHLPTVRGRKQESTLGAWRLDRADLHDVPPSTDCRDRKPIGHAFTEGGQVRRHSEISLCALKVPAESCDHLVENEQGAMVATKILNLMQEICRAVRAIGTRLFVRQLLRAG